MTLRLFTQYSCVPSQWLQYTHYDYTQRTRQTPFASTQFISSDPEIIFEFFVRPTMAKLTSIDRITEQPQSDITPLALVASSPPRGPGTSSSGWYQPVNLV